MGLKVLGVAPGLSQGCIGFRIGAQEFGFGIYRLP